MSTEHDDDLDMDAEQGQEGLASASSVFGSQQALQQPQAGSAAASTSSVASKASAPVPKARGRSLHSPALPAIPAGSQREESHLVVANGTV